LTVFVEEEHAPAVIKAIVGQAGRVELATARCWSCPAWVKV